MTLTDRQIAALEAKGFKRWTKGNNDRLYVNASDLGLTCTYYKTGNIHTAELNGQDVSNAEARRMKAAKTYIDISTGEIVSDNKELKAAAETIVSEINAEIEAEDAAEAEDSVDAEVAGTPDMIREISWIDYHGRFFERFVYGNFVYLDDGTILYPDEWDGECYRSKVKWDATEEIWINSDDEVIYTPIRKSIGSGDPEIIGYTKR